MCIFVNSKLFFSWLANSKHFILKIPLIKNFPLMLLLAIHVVIAMYLTIVNLTYIFFARIAEHMGISNLSVQCVKIVKEPAILDHLLEFVCWIDFDHLDTVASDTSKVKLLLIEESWFIKYGKPSLNHTIRSLPMKLSD